MFIILCLHGQAISVSLFLGSQAHGLCIHSTDYLEKSQLTRFKYLSYGKGQHMSPGYTCGVAGDLQVEGRLLGAGPGGTGQTLPRGVTCQVCTDASSELGPHKYFAAFL